MPSSFGGRVRRQVLAVASLAILLGLSATGGACAMELTSKSISPDEPIPMRYVYDKGGCEGSNVSPGLSWSGVPSGTKSIAVTVHDPDAPASGGWWHWIAFDIPSGVTYLAEGASGALPSPSVEARNDFGATGYGGPCPPRGSKPHRYVFTVYALDISQLATDDDDDPVAIEQALEDHTIEKASLTARYGR